MSEELPRYQPETDVWASLKTFTDARIGLGKTGVSIPIRESLAFKLAHAHARDAVFSTLETSRLQQQFEREHWPVWTLKSQATSRELYLQRPDLGRRLHPDSVSILNELESQPVDLAIILADGLSATALNEHGWALVQAFQQEAIRKGYTIAPYTLVEQGRVAIGDEIGALLKARMSIILIGERPGLSSYDSIGAYLTYAPQPGLTDERRNCISNIRPQGLSVPKAVEKLLFLIDTAFRLQLTGVALKDEYGMDSLNE